MATSYVKLRFAYYLDKILVSKSKYFWVQNPMITPKNPYDPWLTLG